MCFVPSLEDVPEQAMLQLCVTALRLALYLADFRTKKTKTSAANSSSFYLEEDLTKAKEQDEEHEELAKALKNVLA